MEICTNYERIDIYRPSNIREKSEPRFRPPAPPLVYYIYELSVAATELLVNLSLELNRRTSASINLVHLGWYFEFGHANTRTSCKKFVMIGALHFVPYL